MKKNVKLYPIVKNQDDMSDTRNQQQSSGDDFIHTVIDFRNKTMKELHKFIASLGNQFNPEENQDDKLPYLFKVIKKIPLLRGLQWIIATTSVNTISISFYALCMIVNLLTMPCDLVQAIDKEDQTINFTFVIGLLCYPIAPVFSFISLWPTPIKNAFGMIISDMMDILWLPAQGMNHLLKKTKHLLGKNKKANNEKDYASSSDTPLYRCAQGVWTALKTPFDCLLVTYQLAGTLIQVGKHCADGPKPKT